MFVGTHHYSIDDKGRLSVPARFKDSMDKANEQALLYLTVDPNQRILLAYPESRYAEILEKLTGDAGANSRALRRHFAANTRDCVIDKQNRIIVPQELREYAGLKRDVAILGVGKNIEIWDRAAYEAFTQQNPTIAVPDNILL